MVILLLKFKLLENPCSSAIIAWVLLPPASTPKKYFTDDFTPKIQIVRKSGDGLIQVFASKYDVIQINGDTISPFDANCNVSIDSIFSYLKSVNHKCYMELTPSQSSKTIVLEEQPNRIL